MSISESIIKKWNKSFRAWSSTYIKPFKQAILQNCLFATQELQKGHSSALRDISKNKGNISQFVLENTDQRYRSLLPNKTLSDTYAFMQNDTHKTQYKMVYRNVLQSFVSWKCGTTNALSREGGLSVQYGHEDFQCKFRKYQLESMKKFIQATPGTKEIRGQWTVSLANDSMMVSFGDGDIVLVIKIGCFEDKLNIMYEENSVLRKNSKIRKQTLMKSCFGLERVRSANRFENSIIIQENYGMELFVKNILSVSTVSVYVKRARMDSLEFGTLHINGASVALNQRPFHIQRVHIPCMDTETEQMLRLKYRATLTHTKAAKVVKPKVESKCIIKDEISMDDTKSFCKDETNDAMTISTNTTNATSDNSFVFTPTELCNDSMRFGMDTPMGFPMHFNRSDPILDMAPNMNGFNDVPMSLFHTTSLDSIPMSNGTNYALHMDLDNGPFAIAPQPFTDGSMGEIERLRQENELLLRRVSDQQRQIEYLTSQIGVIQYPNYNYGYVPQTHNPFKRRRVQNDTVLPPIA